MKVTESSPLSLPGIGGGAPSARPNRTQAGVETSPARELDLAPAAESVFGGRPDRIAQLRQQVEDGTYQPAAELVGEKLISNAISRPE